MRPRPPVLGVPGWPSKLGLRRTQEVAKKISGLSIQAGHVILYLKEIQKVHNLVVMTRIQRVACFESPDSVVSGASSSESELKMSANEIKLATMGKFFMRLFY